MENAPQLQEIELSRIKLIENNPREIAENEFNRLVSDIKTDPSFLIQRPPLLNHITETDKMVCYAGNQRVKAALKAGMKTIWCFVEKDVPKAIQDRRMVLDNAHHGQWNYELLTSAFDFSIEQLAEFKLPGFDEFKAEQLKANQEQLIAEADEYVVPDEVETDIQQGDMFQIGDHYLLCGDASNAEDISKLLGNRIIDLIVTDPPYNVNYQGKTGKKLKIKNDNMSQDDFSSFLKKVFDNYHNVVKDGAPIYVFHADSEGSAFRHCFEAAGFKLSQCLVWVKNGFVMGRQDYHWQHEPCLYGWKLGAAHVWEGERNKSTLLTFDKPLKNDSHPTMKPVKMIAYLIENSSKLADSVLDLFGGSGSKMVACQATGRLSYTMELDPKYCQVIIDRMKATFPHLQIQKIS